MISIIMGQKMSRRKPASEEHDDEDSSSTRSGEASSLNQQISEEVHQQHLQSERLCQWHKLYQRIIDSSFLTAFSVVEEGERVGRRRGRSRRQCLSKRKVRVDDAEHKRGRYRR